MSIEVTHLSVSFGGVRALRDVSLALTEGQVHAVCGENGAGKSTLNKVLCGVCRPDAGHVLVDGRPLAGGVREAEAAGIAINHQEPTLFPNLDAVANLYVGREVVSRGFLRSSEMRTRTAAILAELGETTDLRRPLSELSAAHRQMVAIARAISRPCRLLIMDEPTASLSAREVETLFGVIRRLRSQGVGILYVSHRLEEVLQLADVVSVLRDGELVWTREASGLDREQIIHAMVGRETTGQGHPTSPAQAHGGPLLSASGLCGSGFQNVTLRVNAGEVVGLGGLVGAGRSELARAIFGIEPPSSGHIELEGRPHSPTPGEAMRRGIAYVPEDRQADGLCLPLPIRENLTLARLLFLRRGPLLSKAKESALAEDLRRRFGIKTHDCELPTDSLSGGNQQKTLLARWLAERPKLLILDEPTRGIDVGSKAEIHALIANLAASGVGVLLISSDLAELLACSDRVVIMREGRVSGELSKPEATEEAALRLAFPDTSTTSAASHASRRRPAPGLGILAILMLVVTVVGIVNPAFLAGGNLRDVLQRIAPSVIVGCGMSLVVISREIDISVGSLMGLCAAVMGILTASDRLGLPVSVGVAGALLVGGLIGLFNGALATRGRVPSIIVTLGMMTVLRGVTDLAMGGVWITGLPAGLRLLGTPGVALLTAVVSVALTTLALRQTPFGLRLFAVGGNPRAAELIGLDVARIRSGAFLCVGLLTAVATLVSVPQLSVIDAGIGNGFELLVVTCVVVGGTSIRGGIGGALGTTLAAVLLGSIGTALIFLKVGETATYWERAIQGAMILAAVFADHLSRRGRTE